MGHPGIGTDVIILCLKFKLKILQFTLKFLTLNFKGDCKIKTSELMKRNKNFDFLFTCGKNERRIYGQFKACSNQ